MRYCNDSEITLQFHQVICISKMVGPTHLEEFKNSVGPTRLSTQHSPSPIHVCMQFIILEASNLIALKKR